MAQNTLYQLPLLIPRCSARNSKLFLTADEHYGHSKIIEYVNRPFNSIENMNNAIIARHNQVVSENDVVIHIGDICFGSAKDLSDILIQLNGTHFLMDGSHDWALSLLVKEGIPDYLSDKVFVLPKMVEFTYNKNKITLCHYKFFNWWGSHYGSYSFHGHSHGKAPKTPNSLDIGVDVHNFYPINIEKAIEKAAKIVEK